MTDTNTAILSVDLSNLIDEYIDQHDTYKALEVQLRHYFLSLFEDKEIEMQIESRTKTLDSVQEKILRQDKHYRYPLHEITDFVGLRLICYYLEDIDKVGEVLKNTFSIDWKNSVDRRHLFQSADRFGYQSVHYVIEIGDKLGQKADWKPFKGLKAEIQVRTVLQHAWAAIEHSLQYKAEYGVPRALRRRFHRLSALLDLADEEFMAIKEQSKRLKLQHEEEISVGNLNIELDRFSLVEYLKTSELVKYWVQTAQAVGFRFSLRTEYFNSPATSRLLTFLEKADIQMVGDFEHILRKVRDGGETFLKDFLTHCRHIFGKDMTLNAAPQFLLPHLICYYFRHSPKLEMFLKEQQLEERAILALRKALGQAVQLR